MRILKTDKYPIAKTSVYQGDFSGSCLIFTGDEMHGSLHSSPIYMVERGGNLREICPPGDYSHIRSAASANGVIYCVFSRYQSQTRQSQVMLSVIGDKTVKTAPISAPGKYGHPVVAIHQNRIVAAFEDGSAPNPRIAAIVVDPDDPFSGPIAAKHITAPGERAYKPCLISDGDTLYLFYESFFARRYHIMSRCLPDADCGDLCGAFAGRLEVFGDRVFSQGVEIGCDTCNDNAISAALVQGKVAVCWENSSPLYPNDYKWDDGRGNIITMPSFGHGWRVESRMFARRICLHGGFLELGDMEEIEAGADESSGFAIPLADSGGGLFFAYVCFGGHGVGWNLKIRHGLETIDTDLRYTGRTAPSVAIAGDEIIAAGIDGNGQAVIETISFALDEKNCAASAFKAAKKIRLAKLADTPAFREDLRHSVELCGEKLNIYWGDLHCHSNISPCSRHKMFHCTEVDEKHRFSRDVGQLDFMMLTDHETMSDFDWHETKKYAHLSNLDGSFVSFAGFEWTCSMQKAFRNLGHYNILYRDSGDLMRIAENGCHHIEQVWARLKKGEALTIPHHPGDGDHTLDWDWYNPDFEPAAEIYQVRGSYELEGIENCPKHPEKYGRSVAAGHSIRTGLDKGYKLGFTGGGEHEGVGLTAVFAPELTRGAIFEAIQKRRVYATTSAKIMLDFRMDGQFMGSELTLPEDKKTMLCEIYAVGADDIERVMLVRREGETELTGFCGAECGREFKMAAEIAAEPGYYYVRLTQKDGNMAWSSPIFVEALQK